MKINLLTAAEDDFQQGISFYEAQQQDLGKYFYTSILADLESLVIYRGIHTKINGYYRMLAKRFPFAIYYKFDKHHVYIHAILDCRQHPKYANRLFKQ